MKILLPFLVVCLMVSCHSSNRLIVGSWKMVYTQNSTSELNTKVNTERWIEFNKDGTLNSGAYANQTSKTGSWKYNQKNDTIFIEFSDAKETIPWPIHVLTTDSLGVGGDFPIVWFKKVNKKE